MEADSFLSQIQEQIRIARELPAHADTSARPPNHAA
jgi:hypothetical protein